MEIETRYDDGGQIERESALREVGFRVLAAVVGSGCYLS